MYTNSATSIPLAGQIRVVADETLSGASAASPNSSRTWVFDGSTNVTYCLFSSGVTPNPMTSVRNQLRTQAHSCTTVPFSGRHTGTAVPSPFTMGIDIDCYAAITGTDTLVRSRPLLLLTPTVWLVLFTLATLGYE